MHLSKVFSFQGNVIGLILGPLLFVVAYNADLTTNMGAQAQAVLACTLWVAAWWITEAVPIPVTALLPIIIFPLSGALGLKDTTAAYGNPIIFLFLGGFIIALAMEKWNLHKRIALTTILFVGTNKTRMVLGFMVATAFLSMWISNTATTMMMLPIGMAVIGQISHLHTEANLSQQDKLGKALMLGIAYSASIGGMATMVGTPANAIFVAVAEQNLGISLSFYDWMKMAFPLTCFLILVCWFYLVKVAFPLQNQAANKSMQKGIEDQLKALGEITIEEKWILAVFAFTAFCWIGRTFLLNQLLPGLDDSMIAMASTLLLFTIPASAINKAPLMIWKDTEKLPWGILLLFGGGLAIASGFNESGLAVWIGEQLSALNQVDIFVVILCIVAAVNFLTEITSNTATATMMLPIMASMAIAVNIHPLATMAAACLASSCAFMLPVATPPNAIVFGSGYLKMKDMVKAGCWLNILFTLIISLYLYYFMATIWGIDLLQVQ